MEAPIKWIKYRNALIRITYHDIRTIWQIQTYYKDFKE